MPDKLVHDVGQVRHHEQGDHRQGEVRGFQCRPAKIQVLSFGPTQLDISLTWQKCEKGIFVQYDLIFISIGIVMQRTLSRNIELFAFTSNGHSIGKCQLLAYLTKDFKRRKCIIKYVVLGRKSEGKCFYS